MFGKNSTKTPHFFDNEPKNTLQVTSLFETLQGEGPFNGYPSIFVRLAHCNLKCSFCDTFFDHGDRMTYDDIIEFIWQKNDTIEDEDDILPNVMVIITGGEPLMQPNLTTFLKRLVKGEGLQVQIESNGNFYIPIPDAVTLVISPKVNETTREFIKLNLAALNRAQVLKFVISADEEGYKDIPDWAMQWRNEDSKERRLYVSPMNCYLKQPVSIGPDGTLLQRSEINERISFWTPGLLDPVRNQANHEHAAAVALKRRAILTIQQHLYANLP